MLSNRINLNGKYVFLIAMAFSCLLLTFYGDIKKNTYEYFMSNDIVINEFSSMNYSNSKFRWCPNAVPYNAEGLDCERLFSGDNDSLLLEFKNWTSPCSFTDKSTMDLSANCSILRNEFPFWSEFYRSPNESNDYSLAFVIIGAKSGEQIIRLLQAVYHPKNVYCITYDNKTSHEFKQTLHNLDDCYSNIVMPETFVDIHWAGFSILQSAMNCLQVLTKQNIPWRYVQILSWNDFPLRTNEEFVRIMKIFNGAQDSIVSQIPAGRSRFYYLVRKYSTIMSDHEDLKHAGDIKNIPPGNLLEYAGSLATTMSREFVEFLFTNSVAKKFYEWVNTTYCPEEIYWSTMIHNLHINPPGGYPGTCTINYELRKPLAYVSRYQTWKWQNKCNGIFTSYSCIFGVQDLFQLISRPEFVAHKVYLDFQPATYYCLAQLHFNRTYFPEKYSDLNETIYNDLPAVRYRRLKDKEKFKCY